MHVTGDQAQNCTNSMPWLATEMPSLSKTACSARKGLFASRPLAGPCRVRLSCKEAYHAIFGSSEHATMASRDNELSHKNWSTDLTGLFLRLNPM